MQLLTVPTSFRFDDKWYIKIQKKNFSIFNPNITQINSPGEFGI